MKLKSFRALILLSILIAHLRCEDDPLKILKANFEQYPNGGIKLTISDKKEVFNLMYMLAIFRCKATNSNINCSQYLTYDFKHRQWKYENLAIPYCADATFIFAMGIWGKVIKGQVPIRVLYGSERLVYSVVTNKTIRAASEDTSKDVVNLINNFSTMSLPFLLPYYPNLIFIKQKECEHSETLLNNIRQICKGDLIFEDNFDTEVSSEKWTRDIRIPLDTEDADFVSFQNLNKNLYIKNGCLYILPTLLTDHPNFDDRTIRTGTLDLGISCTAIVDRSSECKREASTFQILPPVVSARITTKHSFTFKYGIIEIRAKLPKGDWLFPQLFLEPSNNFYGTTNYSSGQIRLAFIRGNEILNTIDGKPIGGYKLLGGVVLTQGEKFRNLWMKNFTRGTGHFGNGFHVYRTTWTDEFISFEVDGYEYGKIQGPFLAEASRNHIQQAENWKVGNSMAPFDQEFFLSLGLSVGGISDFPDESVYGHHNSNKKPWDNLDVKNQLRFWEAEDNWYPTWDGEKAALKVDYVRVWAL